MPYKNSDLQRKYYDSYREKQENKDSQWRSQLKIVHSITPEEYLEILAKQGGVCAICEKPPGGKRLCVDHDHSCCPGVKHCKNCIRGLLCRNCNRGIGLLGDTVKVLTKAAEYLRG